MIIPMPFVFTGPKYTFVSGSVDITVGDGGGLYGYMDFGFGSISSNTFLYCNETTEYASILNFYSASNLISLFFATESSEVVAAAIEYIEEQTKITEDTSTDWLR